MNGSAQSRRIGKNVAFETIVPGNFVSLWHN
jgi:hypothetical protein